MHNSKNNISIEDNKNIIKQKNIINKTKYLSLKEKFKVGKSINNINNINKNIILRLKKNVLNYKILSIFFINIIMILLNQNNKTKIDIFPKENNSNYSIFDIVYNDVIFNNYINGDFFSTLSNNKTIFFVKTDYLDNQAWNVTKNYTVLLTHNSDYGIDFSKFKKFLQCGKYKYWFAENLYINEPRLFALPIGLMNKDAHTYSRFNLMMEIKKKNIKPTKLLLLSFSIENNVVKRQQCADSFINKTFVTYNAVQKVKNILGDVKKYDWKFFHIMLDHLFIACPEGNGIDTHRFWETLYMGRYPVVLHNTVNDAFSDLPVLILNKWEDFEKEYLIFLERIKNKEFSYKKLTQEYWIERINNLE